jgi:peroxiredoxin
LESIIAVSSVLLWVIVLFNLLLTLALVRRVNHGISSPEQGLKTGETVPAFMAQTLNGEIVTHATYAKQPTLFVFISTHCKPCRELLPTINRLNSGTQRAGVELVLVSSDNLADTQMLVNDMQIQVPTLVAPRSNNAFFDDFKITGTPAYCYVDEEGKVQSAGYPGPHLSKWKALTAAWITDSAPITSERR